MGRSTVREKRKTEGTMIAAAGLEAIDDRIFGGQNKESQNADLASGAPRVTNEKGAVSHAATRDEVSSDLPINKSRPGLRGQIASARWGRGREEGGRRSRACPITPAGVNGGPWRRFGGAPINSSDPFTRAARPRGTSVAASINARARARVPRITIKLSFAL